MRVLVVDDYRPLADLVAEGLSDQGMAADVAYDGTEAEYKLNINAYDVVVLDRNLPGIHGDALCKMISGHDKRVMVLMLSGAESPGDRVRGLSLGADDYMTKPFHFPELVLRVRALARRRPCARSPVVQVAGIELDSVCRSVRRQGHPVELSPKEFPQHSSERTGLSGVPLARGVRLARPSRAGRRWQHRCGRRERRCHG